MSWLSQAMITVDSCCSLEILHLEEMTVALSAQRCPYPLSAGLTMEKLLDLKLFSDGQCDDVPEPGVELSKIHACT